LSIAYYLVNFREILVVIGVWWNFIIIPLLHSIFEVYFLVFRL